jgi:hypothetical protein
MSYRTQAILARDPQLIERVSACAATQNVSDPSGWAWSHQWELSAEPGWDAAYAYALDTNVVDPGNSEVVINDSMILAAVQAMLSA